MSTLSIIQISFTTSPLTQHRSFFENYLLHSLLRLPYRYWIEGKFEEVDGVQGHRIVFFDQLVSCQQSAISPFAGAFLDLNVASRV